MSGWHNPLILGASQEREIAALRDKATKEPIDMAAVMPLMQSEEGRRQHIERMQHYTINLPLAYVVTYTIETGHPCGTCRHLSMSSKRMGKVPTITAVKMVCEAFGFVVGSSLDQCTVWLEEIGAGDQAVNVVQPLDMAAPPGRA